MQFDFTLTGKKQQCFLTTFSALAWTIWKQRNIICFYHHTCDSQKSIVLSILTTMLYWSGLGIDTTELANWMPPDTSLIRLQTWDPAEKGQMIIISDDDEDED